MCCAWQTPEYNGKQRGYEGRERRARTFPVSAVELFGHDGGADDTDRLVRTGLGQARLHLHVSLVSRPVAVQLPTGQCLR